MQVKLLAFCSFRCILSRAQLARFSSLIILGPKLLVACMRSVMYWTHTHTKKPPKTNHANAPVTCRLLCAISYLQSMQQQRLDEKLILPLSVSLAVSISIWQCLCAFLVYFSLSIFFSAVKAWSIVQWFAIYTQPWSIPPDSQIQSRASSWGQETLTTPNLKQYLQAGGQMQPSTTLC